MEIYEWKYTNEKYTNAKYTNKTIRIEHMQHSNVFLTKPNGKSAQPNINVGLPVSKCTWSNVN